MAFRPKFWALDGKFDHLVKDNVTILLLSLRISLDRDHYFKI